MTNNYKCTHCGKPARTTWNRYGLKWGACEEHEFYLIENPKKKTFLKYIMHKNGESVYKKVTGGMYIYKNWSPIWIEFGYGGIAPDDTNGK